MHPIDEHATTIGPWGYIGYLMAAAVLLLYYRLWTSTRVVELRKLREELEIARETISELRVLEMKLKNRNDELSTAHHRLHSEYTELRGQFSELQKAYGKLADLQSQLREDLNTEKRLRDEQFMELMRHKAKNGDL